jgi:hypothetical protein
MRNLLRRLEKLEAATPSMLDGPWLWPAKAAEVEQCAMRLMLPEDRILIKELLEIDPSQQNEFIETHRGVWDRWNEAFGRATREVPAPYTMSAHDLLGWD